MASYNQHDEDRDYRGRNQNPSNQNRDWNNRFDDDRRGQQRWQNQDADTRGVSGNDGYSRESSSDDRRNSWDQNRSRNNYTDHARQSWENQSWRRDQDDASRRYSNDYGSSSRNQSYGSSYGQQDQDRRRSADNDNDRSWSSASGQDRSRNMNSVYGRSSDLSDRSRNQGYGSSYGQQAYTSGSDPNAYGRDQRRDWSSSSDRSSRDDRSRNQSYGGSASSNRNWQAGHNSWDSSRDNQNYSMRNDSDYAQDFYDRDENSRYRQQRSHRDDDQHEDQGFFGRMVDRVSHWFSDDEDDNRDTRRNWQDRDQRRSY